MCLGIKILAHVRKCRPNHWVIILHMEHNEKCIGLQQFGLKVLKGCWADGTIYHNELNIMCTGLTF
jgi:hypothetical protein